MVYDVMERFYVPADWAEPYVEKKLQCAWNKGTSVRYKTRDFTVADDPSFPPTDPQKYMKQVRGEQEMMYEVWKNGPGGVYVKVGDLFQNYKDSVLRDSTCSRGVDGKCIYVSADTNHACTLVGWGRENGIPYWLVPNFSDM